MYCHCMYCREYCDIVDITAWYNLSIQHIFPGIGWWRKGKEHNFSQFGQISFKSYLPVQIYACTIIFVSLIVKWTNKMYLLLTKPYSTQFHGKNYDKLAYIYLNVNKTHVRYIYVQSMYMLENYTDYALEMYKTFEVYFFLQVSKFISFWDA